MKKTAIIPFNQPYLTGKELDYITEAHTRGMLAGRGHFSKQCQTWLETSIHCNHAMLTHSCTAALEMTALLLNLAPGDEVIMPSFTFVSTANAFVLRGATPVFVDIRNDTLNINESLIEDAITPRTKAIVVVHYAGVSCEMDTILTIAKRHRLAVIEDAAQGVLASYKDKPLGSLGTLAAVSFHETKNIICGEGGALLINTPDYIERAEIILEKGTDRSRFFRGEVDKYTWQDIGSSFVPGEISAAFLYAQMQQAKEITQKRLTLWNHYHGLFAGLEASGHVRRPTLPPDCQHNAHIYYLLLPNESQRDYTVSRLKEAGIYALTHYVPLHRSPGGKRFGRISANLSHTDNLASRLMRLPLWIGLSHRDQERIATTISALLKATP